MIFWSGLRNSGIALSKANQRQITSTSLRYFYGIKLVCDPKIRKTNSHRTYVRKPSFKPDDRVHFRNKPSLVTNLNLLSNKGETPIQLEEGDRLAVVITSNDTNMNEVEGLNQKNKSASLQVDIRKYSKCVKRSKLRLFNHSSDQYKELGLVNENRTIKELDDTMLSENLESTTACRKDLLRNLENMDQHHVVKDEMIKSASTGNQKQELRTRLKEKAYLATNTDVAQQENALNASHTGNQFHLNLEKKFGPDVYLRKCYINEDPVIDYLASNNPKETEMSRCLDKDSGKTTDKISSILDLKHKENEISTMEQDLNKHRNIEEEIPKESPDIENSKIVFKDNKAREKKMEKIGVISNSKNNISGKTANNNTHKFTLTSTAFIPIFVDKLKMRQETEIVPNLGNIKEISPTPFNTSTQDITPAKNIKEATNRIESKPVRLNNSEKESGIAMKKATSKIKWVTGEFSSSETNSKIVKEKINTLKSAEGERDSQDVHLDNGNSQDNYLWNSKKESFKPEVDNRNMYETEDKSIAASMSDCDQKELQFCSSLPLIVNKMNDLRSEDNELPKWSMKYEARDDDMSFDKSKQCSSNDSSKSLNKYGKGKDVNPKSSNKSGSAEDSSANKGIKTNDDDDIPICPKQLKKSNDDSLESNQDEAVVDKPKNSLLSRMKKGFKDDDDGPKCVKQLDEDEDIPICPKKEKKNLKIARCPRDEGEIKQPIKILRVKKRLPNQKEFGKPVEDDIPICPKPKVDCDALEKELKREEEEKAIYAKPKSDINEEEEKKSLKKESKCKEDKAKEDKEKENESLNKESKCKEDKLKEDKEKEKESLKKESKCKEDKLKEDKEKEVEPPKKKSKGKDNVYLLKKGGKKKPPKKCSEGSDEDDLPICPKKKNGEDDPPKGMKTGKGEDTSQKKSDCTNLSSAKYHVEDELPLLSKKYTGQEKDASIYSDKAKTYNIGEKENKNLEMKEELNKHSTEDNTSPNSVVRNITSNSNNNMSSSSKNNNNKVKGSMHLDESKRNVEKEQIREDTELNLPARTSNKVKLSSIQGSKEDNFSENELLTYPTDIKIDREEKKLYKTKHEALPIEQEIKSNNELVKLSTYRGEDVDENKTLPSDKEEDKRRENKIPSFPKRVYKEIKLSKQKERSRNKRNRLYLSLGKDSRGRKKLLPLRNIVKNSDIFTPQLKYKMKKSSSDETTILKDRENTDHEQFNLPDDSNKQRIIKHPSKDTPKHLENKKIKAVEDSSKPQSDFYNTRIPHITTCQKESSVSITKEGSTFKEEAENVLKYLQEFETRSDFGKEVESFKNTFPTKNSELNKRGNNARIVKKKIIIEEITLLPYDSNDVYENKLSRNPENVIRNEETTEQDTFSKILNTARTSLRNKPGKTDQKSECCANEKKTKNYKMDMQKISGSNSSSKTNLNAGKTENSLENENDNILIHPEKNYNDEKCLICPMKFNRKIKIKKRGYCFISQEIY